MYTLNISYATFHRIFLDVGTDYTEIISSFAISVENSCILTQRFETELIS